MNSYGKTLKEPISFAQLLRRVEQIEGLERIRFMTSHPKDLSDELIEVMKESKKILPSSAFAIAVWKYKNFKGNESALYEGTVFGIGTKNSYGDSRYFFDNGYYCRFSRRDRRRLFRNDGCGRKSTL